MNEQNTIQPIDEMKYLQNIIINEVPQKISDTATDAENISKEKYATKKKLIESAKDMSTQEKLNAMDKNYDLRNHERWQNVFRFAIISFGLFGIAIGSPVAVKNVHRILSAT